MSADVVAWGLGDQFRVIEPILRTHGYRVVVGIDDTADARRIWSSRMSVGRDLSDLVRLSQGLNRGRLGFVVAIGNPYGRSRVVVAGHLKSLGMSELSAVSAHSLVLTDNPLGEGAQFLPGSVVHVNADIGRQVILNTRAVVEHDCVLADGVEVGPGAVLCGRVRVDKYAWVGAGATVLPRVRIGEEAIVGAGACVTRDVPPGAVVGGCPARDLKGTRWRIDERRASESQRLSAQLSGPGAVE